MNIEKSLKNIEVKSKKYTIRVAQNDDELKEVLKLRYDVFHRELKDGFENPDMIDSDPFDHLFYHLIAIDNFSSKIIGTYRFRLTDSDLSKIYSNTLFDLSSSPPRFFNHSVEIGRACIHKDFRRSLIFLLLWRALTEALLIADRSLFFGSFSIHLNDSDKIAGMIRHMRESKNFNPSFQFVPRFPFDVSEKEINESEAIEMPELLKLYFKYGATVCGMPSRDESFGTVDFLTVIEKDKMIENIKRFSSL